MKTAHADGKSSAFTLTIPVAVGYIPLGAVFGFLFVQAGAPWWQALLASTLVYAGASQYMMVPMLAAGLPVASIALAALLVNLRHVFYGLSLLDRFPARGMLRWYMVFGLTDESFSILTTLPRDASVRDMAMLVFLNQCWWLLGTAIGAFAGAHANLPLRGLDFVLASLFAVLLAEQWRQRSSAAPLWIALASYGIGMLAAPKQALLVAIGLCVLAALAWKPRDVAETPKEIE